MFTIELNNLEKSYSRIFKKHDQTSINLTVFDFYKLNFRIMLRLMKSNGFVPLLNILKKIYKKVTFLVNELILTPLSPFDIKCKKFKRKKGWREDGRMPPNTF